MNSEMNGVVKSMNYYLTKRKKAKRSYFYVNFTDPEDSRKIRLSTSVELLRRKIGERSRIPITRAKDAYVVVERAIEDGLINLDREDRLFSEYVEDFWDFDNSAYIRRRNKKSPNSIGKDYSNTMLGNFKRHAKPYLPIKLRVHEVTSLHIEKVVDTLLDKGELSNATIQKVVQSMAGPLKEATRKKLIAHNPMDGVEPITSTYKQRGIYTIEELLKIMAHLHRKGTVGVQETKKVRGPHKTTVDKSYLVKTDLKPYLAVSLAAYTGMRAGEIRALCAEQILLVNDTIGIIIVDRAFNDYAGQKSTKGKRTRKVPAPRDLCELLLKEAASNPHEDNTMVFWSKTSDRNPISSNHILKHFYKAMDAIGIKEPERIERNLDFHSLRHTFNSTLRGRINDNVLRSVVGHESAAMTDRYTHGTDEDLLSVGNTVISVFQEIENDASSLKNEVSEHEA
jgi:integrase